MNIEKKTKAIIIGAGVVIAVALVSVLIWYLWQPRYDLTAVYVNEAPEVDGIADDEVWDKAEGLVLPVKDGPDVELKAVYTDAKIFFRARYKDSTKDSTYYSWEYDGKAWRRGRSSDGLVLFIEQGETIEDFADKGFEIMDAGFGTQNDMYQFTQTGGKRKQGYWPGYKGRADIWIMGAGYTMPFGLADDGFFGVEPTYLVNPTDREARLITQWDQFDATEVVKLNTIAWREAAKASEGAGAAEIDLADEPYLMYKDKADNLKNTPYPSENQLTPIPDGAVFSRGDQLPLVYFESASPGRWGGSRSDVTGEMVWKNGSWTVVATRLLDTGHQDDVVFDAGSEEPVNFGVVVRWSGKQTTSFSPPARLRFAPKGGD